MAWSWLGMNQRTLSATVRQSHRMAYVVIFIRLTVTLATNGTLKSTGDVYSQVRNRRMPGDTANDWFGFLSVQKQLRTYVVYENYLLACCYGNRSWKLYLEWWLIINWSSVVVIEVVFSSDSWRRMCSRELEKLIQMNHNRSVNPQISNFLDFSVGVSLTPHCVLSFAMNRWRSVNEYKDRWLAHTNSSLKAQKESCLLCCHHHHHYRIQNLALRKNICPVDKVENDRVRQRRGFLVWLLHSIFFPTCLLAWLLVFLAGWQNLRWSKNTAAG